MIKGKFLLLVILFIVFFLSFAALYYKTSAKPENLRSEEKNSIVVSENLDKKSDANVGMQEKLIDKNDPEAVKAYYESKKTFNSSTIPDELKCEDCNIVIISATNVRKDHLSLYGYDRNTTPNIDKFAEDSLVFNSAFAPASWTLPNNISLYTSLFPYEHGVMNRFEENKLNPAVTSLVDILKDNGYKTAAFTGGFDYGEKWGLISRFDEKSIYKNKINSVMKSPEVSEYGRLSSIVGRAEEWLKKNKEEKFLLLIQGYDAHCPFNPSDPYDKLYADRFYGGNLKSEYCYVTFEPKAPVVKNGIPYYKVKTLFFNPAGASEQDKKLVSLEFELNPRDIKRLNDLYDGEIKQVDDTSAQIFESLEALDLYKKTIVIFMSDHGDLIGEHDRFMRGGPVRGTFYNEVINFPLVIKNPKFSAKRIDGLVQTVDIMPTVLDFIGISAKYQSQGKSLVPLINNDEEINEFVFAGSAYNPGVNNYFFSRKSRTSAAINENWKLIKEEVGVADGGMPNDRNEKFVAEEVSYELYDIRNDPRELKNLYPEENTIFKNLRNELDKWEFQFNLRESNAP